MPTVGDLIGGRYHLTGKLGHGTFGEVYRADDLNQRDTVAVKIMKPSMIPTVAAVWQEAARLTGVRGDFLLTIRNADQAAGYPYIAMDLVDGAVGDHAPAAGMPPSEVVRVMHQAATGISRVHDAGLIHCDIKPDNLFIDGRMIRVGDLGLATERAGPSHNRCTPATMAPEVAAANLAEISTGMAQPGRNSVASDVYSLGATAYRLACGRYPHEFTTGMTSLADYYDSVVTTDPPRLIDLAPHVPPLLGRHIETALAKKPGDRYDNPAQFAAALANLSPARLPWERTDQHGTTHHGCWQATPSARAPLAVCLIPDGKHWKIEATRGGRRHKAGCRDGITAAQRASRVRSALGSF